MALSNGTVHSWLESDDDDLDNGGRKQNNIEKEKDPEEGRGSFPKGMNQISASLVICYFLIIIKNIEM